MMVTLNIDLPHGCADCKFGRSYGMVGDRYCRILGNYFTDNIEPPFKERPDQCPLNPMPEDVSSVRHGRLIDADALKPYTLHFREVVMYEDIKNAPTIIPASD